MNPNVINNYSKLKPTILLLPLVLLVLIFIFLYSKDALTSLKYVEVQKDYFFFINHHLGKYPNIEYNLTQLGDASILLSFLTIFIVYAPKLWESLLSASLVCLIFSYTLKNIFCVPRPCKVFALDSFIIIGKKAVGFSSLPSGHSITAFTILTALLFAFMPKKMITKISWTFLVLMIGFIIAFSRVGVGAHHPLDVIIGSIIGFLSGLLGIFISRKYKIGNWISNKKYYPIFILFILVCCVSIAMKIINENLLVFYLALISLFVALFKITYEYAKK